MKKRNLLIVALFLIGIVSANAQMFKKGDGVGNLTIGFGNARYTSLSGTTSSVPPLAVSYEAGILDNVLDKGSIGLGGYLGYTSAKWDFGSGWSVKSTDIIIGARGVFHYPLVDKLDTYAGLMLAYDINSWKETGAPFGLATSSSFGGLIFPGFVGARYYFTDQFAALAELGWGIAYFNIGIALKLK